jgi:cytosine/adenosine deaminase-related metal-dependent hydrolase
VIIRPYGVVIDGELQLGDELVVEDGIIQEIRPHTGMPEPWIISPAFVNAHSHLEYRGLQGQLSESEFHHWILEIGAAKTEQLAQQVRADCLIAAQENRAAGIAWIAEHSDRLGAREAMAATGLNGVIFQEVITLIESADPGPKLDAIREKAQEQDAHLTPHAPYTVDRTTLESFASGRDLLSIHASESPAEQELFHRGTGPISDIHEKFGFELGVGGMSPIQYLNEVGFLRPGRQLVHVCEADEADIDLIAAQGVSIAHCPRSNDELSCRPAPTRQLLEAGVPIGLGLDSAASSGPINMFSEMLAALEASYARKEPISPESVWRMACEGGAESLGLSGWRIEVGSRVPLLKLNIESLATTEEMIEQMSVERVEWLQTD